MRRGVLTLSRRMSQAMFSVRSESMHEQSAAHNETTRDEPTSRQPKKERALRLAQVHEVEGL
jgi:hypothetical protein